MRPVTVLVDAHLRTTSFPQRQEIIVLIRAEECCGVAPSTFSVPENWEKLLDAMSRHWPETMDDVRRVTQHWVVGCDADVVATLYQMENGTVYRSENGFLVSDDMQHALPHDVVPDSGPQSCSPGDLVRLGCYVAWHARLTFAKHVHLVEMNRTRNDFWKALHAVYIRSVSPPTHFQEVLNSVQHPTLRRLVWRSANSVLASCDQAVVSSKMEELLSHPVPMTSSKAHASLRHFVGCTSAQVVPCERGVGVVQYPCAALTMSRVDHILWVILSVFFRPAESLCTEFADFKSFVEDHSKGHPLNAMQTILEEWRQEHRRQRSE